MSPALAGLWVQVGAGLCAWLLLWFSGFALTWWWPLQAVLALLLSVLCRQPRWWWLIHASFVPAVFLALRLNWPPWFYLLAFVFAWLLFGRIDRSRVPLYLSNRAALEVLDDLVPRQGKVLDLGAGTGTVLAWLGRRADIQVDGVEHAWLTWLIARLRLAMQGSRAKVWRGELMQAPLADYDVVYAFLSPAAMPSLWDKAKREMSSGSLLVSNTFEVPGVPADKVIELNDWKGASLYLWRMP
ncbi:methyltransferase domain-containing protein [Chitinimonas sp. PSY-7]|uniref:methyltransferase domain-containing protein n=1 Tax=Chitinimonas sp. PSY-7 TaxID=3459088 RepID=UPI00403FC8FE